VETGSLPELRHLTRTAISVQTATPLDGLASVPGVHNLVLDGVAARFDVDTRELEAVHRFLAARGVRSLASAPPTLEELFLRHYAGDSA
jgi:ABC-2 type transport system ATP-binding protein